MNKKKTVLVISPPPHLAGLWFDSVAANLNNNHRSELAVKVVYDPTVLEGQTEKGEFCAVVVFGEEQRLFAEALIKRFVADGMGIRVILVAEQPKEANSVLTVYEEDIGNELEMAREVFRLAAIP